MCSWGGLGGKGRHGGKCKTCRRGGGAEQHASAHFVHVRHVGSGKKGGQNAKHEQPSAPQKLLRSSAGALPVQAWPWSWPWTRQARAWPCAAGTVEPPKRRTGDQSGMA